MSYERRLSDMDNRSLAHLVKKTPMLEYRGNGAVCKEKIEVPLDEYGIPRRVELMRKVLGTLEVAHHWTGDYDLHHIAWPGVNYRKITDSNGELVGSYYRGAGSLKVMLPRQMHNYLHAITLPPPMPTFDVMRQYAHEHDQVSRLYDAISKRSYDDFPELAQLPFWRQEELRGESYLRKLDTMTNGEVGLMPNIDYLADLTIQEARPVLRSIARAQWLTNARQTRRQFFSGELAA